MSIGENLPSSTGQWDGRHNVPIREWASIDEVRVEGAARHVILPAGSESFQLDALVLPRNSETLIVAFHGAIKRDQYKIPRFEWFSTLRQRTENLMFVSDSTLSISESLILAWYTGNGSDDLTRRYASLIGSVIEQLGVKRIVLFGFSGGGFVALAMARHLRGATAIAFSPQTAIDAYYPAIVDAYFAEVFPGVASPEKANQLYPGRLSLLDLYRDGTEEHDFWYLQNAGDQHHVRNHYTPFKELVSGRPGARFSLVDDGEGHIVPSKEQVIAVLDEWIASARNCPERDARYDHTE